MQYVAEGPFCMISVFLHAWLSTDCNSTCSTASNKMFQEALKIFGGSLLSYLHTTTNLLQHKVKEFIAISTLATLLQKNDAELHTLVSLTFTLLNFRPFDFHPTSLKDLAPSHFVPLLKIWNYNVKCLSSRLWCMLRKLIAGPISLCKPL